VGGAALERAGALIDERRFAEAVEPAAEACRVEPGSAGAWWNYGVALKHTHQWAECLRACERAIELAPDDSDGPCWNAGIAATALGNWRRARRAWTDYGIEVPGGTGPIEMAIGSAPVRVSLDGEPEVVWCRRLDPCRGRIESVPLPDSNRRYGDLVLHDGEPRGQRRLGERMVSVFDELVLLERSDFATWRIVAACRSAAERDALLELFDRSDGAIEDWTDNIQVLCAKCSLGEPHEHEPRADDAPWRTERELGAAVRDDLLLARLRKHGAVRELQRVL
jgi:tetratricopeptide (TPR) repeat protein